MPTSHDVAEIGLKLIAVYFVMQGLAVIAPIAATLGTMPSIPPARWFVSLAHPAALIVSGLAIYAGSRLGARAIAGKLGTPPGGNRRGHRICPRGAGRGGGVCDDYGPGEHLQRLPAEPRSFLPYAHMGTDDARAAAGAWHLSRTRYRVHPISGPAQEQLRQSKGHDIRLPIGFPAMLKSLHG